MPAVSVIVPVYNVASYLTECMDSLVQQTLHDIEIICVNDGSTDESLEILQSYADHDARIIIIDKENAGYGAAINSGFDRATGEYIGIVEPDDFVSFNMFEDLYTIAKDNELDFIKADFYRFERRTSGDMFLAYEHLSPYEKDYNVVFDPSMTPEAIRWVMNTWCGIYRREFLEQWHIRHNETPGASFQDNGFWFQTFAFAERAMIIDKPYYMNRRDNPNSSVKDLQKIYATNVEYDHIKDVLMEHPETWERFKGYYILKRYHNALTTTRRIADECKEAYVMRFSKEMKRAQDLEESDANLYDENELTNIKMLIEQPHQYYQRKAKHATDRVREGSNSWISRVKYDLDNYEQLQAKYEQVRTELDEIIHSESYHVGRGVLFIPRKLKQLIQGKRNENDDAS